MQPRTPPAGTNITQTIYIKDGCSYSEVTKLFCSQKLPHLEIQQVPLSVSNPIKMLQKAPRDRGPKHFYNRL